MADYFQLTSFTVKATKKQGEWLQGMAAAIQAFINDESYQDAKKQIGELKTYSKDTERIIANAQEGGIFDCGDISVQHDKESGSYVWIHSELNFDPDHTAFLMQVFLRKFKIKEGIGFSWADTCSSPRADAFGGGACWVTAEKIEWCSTHDFLHKRMNGK